MRRRLITSALCAMALLAFATPHTALGAPGGGGGSVGSGGAEQGVITAGVTYRSDPERGGGGDGCSWKLSDGEISVMQQGTISWPRTDANGVVLHLWQRICPGQSVNWYEFAEASPRDLLPQLLRRLKSRELPAPVPVFEHLDSEFGWAYVTVPLDFRAGEGSWRPVSVTASIGPLWATVTARPVSLTFDPGDPANPAPVSCAGDGPIAEYVAAAPGACSYTYVNASSTSPVDGQHFATSLATAWEISWTSSTGAGGALDGFETTATAPLAVAEVKGIVTCTGARSEQGGC